MFQSTHINVLTYHICTSYITVAARKAEQNFRQTNVFQRINDDDDDTSYDEDDDDDDDNDNNNNNNNNKLINSAHVGYESERDTNTSS